jgi:hypothetical protein
MVKKRESTEEWWRRLQNDPEYIKRRQEQDRLTAERVAKYRAEQAPLVAELRQAGLDVLSVRDLVNTPSGYEEAIPILLRHLQLPYSDVTRETIARTLAVPSARFAWPTLVDQFKKARMDEETGITSGAKDALAVALAATATEAVVEELIALARDRSHGTSRILLLSALRKSKNALAKKALENLSSDPDLAIEIASWHKKRRK